MELIALQHDILWHAPEANIVALERSIAAASPQPGALVVLPEMCLSGFSREVAPATQSEPEMEQRFSEMARRFGCAIMAGLAVKSGDCGANESVTWGPDGRELARYRKLQPFSPAGEHLHYPAGDRVVVFEYGGFRIAPFICYDLRFPEIFRAAAAQGAELIAVVANWPDRRQAHWTTLLKARAIENQAAVIGVNRAGTDPEFTYAGGSLILGPQAEMLAEAGDAPGFVRAEISPGLVRDWRAAFPALRDRRNDYDKL